MRLIFALACCMSLSGCVGSIAADIITAPVKVAGKAIDAVTLNQPATHHDTRKAGQS